MENHLDKKLDLVEKMIAKNPHADYLTILKEEPVHRNHFSISKNYVLSVLFYPYGFYLFFKLYFVEEEKLQALICLALTLLMSFIVIQGFNDLFPAIKQVSTSQQSSPYTSIGL